MKLSITILGCGNSAGTPEIGNYWGDCDPSEPRNRRTRPSIAVRSAKTTLIVDTGADFREQLNREDIQNFDAVLYSHAHGDHLHGIDDIRGLFLRTAEKVTIYGNNETLDEIQDRFSYLFHDRHAGAYPAVLDAVPIEREKFGLPFTVGDIEIIPFEQDHGTCMSLGFRFGDLAYSTDMKNLEPEALDCLKGIKTWIVDGAAYHSPENRVHAGLEKVYTLNEVVGAERVILTHLPCKIDYRTILGELPDGYEPAHDGLQVIATL